MDIRAIITAGGTSSRFGNTNKLLEKINSKELIFYTVKAFLDINEINQILISANSSIVEILQNLFKNEPKIKIIQGGNTRQQSVYNALSDIKTCDYVLIHDGARPMISKEIIEETIKTVQKKHALTVATKTTDTIKQVDNNLKIIQTIDRSALYNTQTPQAFEYNLIKKAHEELKGQDFTDDAGMLEFLGYNVYIVNGDYKNIKITTASDLQIAKIYLKQM